MSTQDEKTREFAELMRQLPRREQLLIHAVVVALSLCNAGKVDPADAAELRAALKANDSDALEAWLVQYGYLDESAPTS